MSYAHTVSVFQTNLLNAHDIGVGLEDVEEEERGYESG